MSESSSTSHSETHDSTPGTSSSSEAMANGDPPVTTVSRTSPAVELADVLRIVQEQVAAAIGRAAYTHPSPGLGTLVPASRPPPATSGVPGESTQLTMHLE